MRDADEGRKVSLHSESVHGIVMQQSTVILQVELPGKCLEAAGASIWFLLAVLVSVILRVAFVVGGVRARRAEVELGPHRLQLAAPHVALDIGHCLETTRKRG